MQETLGAEGRVEGRDLARKGRAGHVVPEEAELLDGARRVDGASADVRAEEFHPVGEQRQHTSAVCQDPADPRTAGEDSLQEQVAYSAGDVEEELQHRSWPAKSKLVGVGR